MFSAIFIICRWFTVLGIIILYFLELYLISAFLSQDMACELHTHTHTCMHVHTISYFFVLINILISIAMQFITWQEIFLWIAHFMIVYYVCTIRVCFLTRRKRYSMIQKLKTMVSLWSSVLEKGLWVLPPYISHLSSLNVWVLFFFPPLISSLACEWNTNRESWAGHLCWYPKATQPSVHWPSLNVFFRLLSLLHCIF